MVDLAIVVDYLRPVAISVGAGLAYTLSGYLNYWVEQRKVNADAPWEWKKLGATATVAVVIGLGAGLWQNISGQSVETAILFVSSIGLNTLLRKWANSLWHVKDNVVELGARLLGR